MDETDRRTLLKLAAEVGSALTLVPDRSRDRLDPDQVQQLREAESAAATLASTGVPEHPVPYRQLELALLDGLVVLGHMNLGADVGNKLAAAWALLRDGMTICRFRGMSGAS